MTFGSNVARRLGNKLYEVAFPVYRPLYSAFKAYTDRAERRLLADTLCEGDVVVDGGANIGTYSRVLSKWVGSSGLVHSFEPAAENFAHLCAAVAKLPNVRANQMALSDRSGEQLLYLSRTLNIDHRTYRTNGESRPTASIRSIRLDDYFEAGDRVNLIKLDIQGYELHALQGAQRVLSDNPTIKLLLEFWPYGLRNAGHSPEALLAFLEDNGFTVFSVGGDKLREYAQCAPCASDDRSFLNLFARR